MESLLMYLQLMALKNGTSRLLNSANAKKERSSRKNGMRLIKEKRLKLQLISSLMVT